MNVPFRERVLVCSDRLLSEKAKTSERFAGRAPLLSRQGCPLTEKRESSDETRCILIPIDSAATVGDEALHAHCDSNPEFTVNESPNVIGTLQVETWLVGSDSPRRKFIARRRTENGNPSNLSG